jgi:hypothetical protein
VSCRSLFDVTFGIHALVADDGEWTIEGKPLRFGSHVGKTDAATFYSLVLGPLRLGVAIETRGKP